MTELKPDSNSKRWLIWATALTCIFELMTISARIATGISAAEFNGSNPPWLLQIHHMFWSVPFLAVLPLVWSVAGIRNPVAGMALGLIFSDLVHHFVVLPVWVGNTGWHWP